jgi:hypothetical protein
MGHHQRGGRPNGVPNGSLLRIRVIRIAEPLQIALGLFSNSSVFDLSVEEEFSKVGGRAADL